MKPVNELNYLYEWAKSSCKTSLDRTIVYDTYRTIKEYIDSISNKEITE